MPFYPKLALEIPVFGLVTNSTVPVKVKVIKLKGLIIYIIEELVTKSFCSQGKKNKA